MMNSSEDGDQAGQRYEAPPGEAWRMGLDTMEMGVMTGKMGEFI